MRAKVNQDFLYEYLLQHGIKISYLSYMMGMNPGSVINYFKHYVDICGRGKYFSARSLVRLNKALRKMSDQMKDSMVVFGSEQTYTNKQHHTYDPGTIPAIQSLSRFFNLKLFIGNALGWDGPRKNATFSGPSTRRYGRISASDVARINAELLAVAGMLGGIEVVPMERPSVRKHSNETNPPLETADAELDLLEEQLLMEK